jgi:lipopolysaccharide transport system permease protein/teichoic acid transport system permease protein
VDYSYLITKINFRSSIIPLIKLLTALALHIMFLVLLATFNTAYGFYPSWHWLQIPYYLFASVLLIMASLGLLRAVTVFVRDMEQIVQVGMQLMFWATPIFWHHSMLTGKLTYVAFLNPFFYIITAIAIHLYIEPGFLNTPALPSIFGALHSFSLCLGRLCSAV